jgi:hypothetical protein
MGSDVESVLIHYLSLKRTATGFGDDWAALCGDGRFDDTIASVVAGRVDDAVLSMLGRGPGLTPSGDDVLIGIIATLYGAGALDSHVRAAFGRALECAARQRTTAISVEYLYYACRGMAAGPLYQLLVAIGQADRPAATRAVERLRDYGHTSGMDSALGALVSQRFLRRSGTGRHR